MPNAVELSNARRLDFHLENLNFGLMVNSFAAEFRGRDEN